tara:strand:- start:7205 stop:7564 length:360 start_codon:yes stop_codon:yes gene_type:complete
MNTIQKIDFPLGCKITNHDFYSYDPVTDFKEADSIRYLNEDLLQCSFPADDIIIDLGWFGDVAANKGEFRIYIIIHENWEIPFNIIYSKSAKETKELLNKVLQYYSKKEYRTESNQRIQ